MRGAWHVVLPPAALKTLGAGGLGTAWRRLTPPVLQFSGVGAVSVAAQSALLAFVDEQLPLSYVSANVTGVAPLGNRTFDVAVRFVIGQSLKAYSPQVQLLTMLGHRLDHAHVDAQTSDGRGFCSCQSTSV